MRAMHPLSAARLRRRCLTLWRAGIRGQPEIAEFGDDGAVAGP